MNYVYKRISSPVGELTLVACDKGLAAVLWENDRKNRVRLPPLSANPQNPILKKTEKQLKEYFLKKRRTFDLPFFFVGTPFQKKVWQALSQIPYGTKQTYLEIAKRTSSARACRAVGAANGKNPLSIVIPCHRVVGSNGSLTGFAGGLDRKHFLLELEASAQR